MNEASICAGLELELELEWNPMLCNCNEAAPTYCTIWQLS